MENKRERILKAALALFLRRGFDATTMDEVAARAQIAKGTLYLHFNDKADLYVSLLEQKVDALNQALSGIAASDATAGVKLETIIRRNLEFIVHEYSGAEFFHDTQVGHNPEVLKLIKTRITPKLEKLLKVIAGVVKQGVAAREFRKVDPFTVAVRVFGLVNVNVVRRALDPEPMDSAKEAAALRDFVFHGISRNSEVRKQKSEA
jgi:AcrR family transcriptional regulator